MASLVISNQVVNAEKMTRESVTSE